MVASTFTQGPVQKHLFTQAMPMVWGLLANMSIQVIDIWFISRLGDQPLAAMGFVFPVAMMFMSLSIGLSAGVASVIARQVPLASKKQLRRLITDTQLLGFLLAFIAMLTGWLTMDVLFVALGAEPHLLPLIKDYMRIFYVNGLLTMVAMVALSTVRATGNAKLQGMTMLIAAMRLSSMASSSASSVFCRWSWGLISSGA